MTETQKNLIYLLSCAVNGIKPDSEKVRKMDLEQLYQLSKRHSLRAAVHTALKNAGVMNRSFYQAYNKAVRKNIMLDLERSAIFAEFERCGIGYMPLKGAILKELYPENGMREMSDNDVLYDKSKQAAVREMMLKRGYTAESVGETHHDVYMKPPVLNFEMHTSLFSGVQAEALERYYANTRRLLRKDKENQYGYHFTNEDFYVYMTAHEYKHYSSGGTGLRNLLDCYVFCREKGRALNWDYIAEQCRQLEIADFEKKRRKLANKLFSANQPTVLKEAETEMLLYYFSAGAYGTFANVIRNRAKGQSRLSFWLHSIFIPRKVMAKSVPFTRKSPLLYPAGVIWRCGRVLLMRRDRLKTTVKVLRKHDKRNV